MTETTTVTVQAVAGVKEGQNAKGKAWKKWSFKGSDDRWYSTFTEGIGTQFVKGETYTVEYIEDDYGRTVKSVITNGPATIQASSISGFTGGEKDRSIVRQVAWKAAVVLCQTIADWGQVTKPEDVFKTAAKIAHGIENDIYRDHPKPPAPAPEGPDDSSIPF